VQPEGSELLAELVVHLPGDPASFVFLREDQPRQEFTTGDFGALPLGDLELQGGIRARQLGRALPYARLVAPGGALVLGGILAEEDPQVTGALEAVGFIQRDRLVFEGWASLRLDRLPASRP